MNKPSEQKIHMNFYDEEAKIVEQPHDTQSNYLEQRNKKYMNNTALTFGPNEAVKMSYEEFHTRKYEYAQALYKRGIREGDLVALGAANTPEGIILMYALNVLGAVTCPVFPLQNEYKMLQDLQIIKPKWYIGINDSYQNFKKASNKSGLDIEVILFSPIGSLDNKMIKALYGTKQFISRNMLLNNDSNLVKILKNGKNFDEAIFPEYQEGKISDVMFTGGSSGVHKGIDLENNGLNCVTTALDYVLPLSPGESFLGNLPINLAFGKLAMHYALSKGLEVKLTLNALPKDFKNELYRLKPTGVMGGPIHWEAFDNDILALLEDPELRNLDFSAVENYEKYLNKIEKALEKVDLSKYNISWLKMPISGGEQLKSFSELISNVIFKKLGLDDELFNGLGMTEMWAPISVKRGKINTTGTVGTLLPFNNHKVVDKNGNELGYDEAGEYMVTGPGMLLSCHNNPEETNKIISTDENGVRWLATGDIVKILPTGETKFVDRTKRSFVCGIENIYPQQIENLLSEIPEIKEVCVTKVIDSKVQYYPKYHIHLRENVNDIEKLDAKIKNKILSTLGESFCPGYIEYHEEELPKTPNGKVAFQTLQQSDDELVKEKSKKLVRIR